MISLVKVKEECIINLRNRKEKYMKFYQRFYRNDGYFRAICLDLDVEYQILPHLSCNTIISSY